MCLGFRDNFSLIANVFATCHFWAFATSLKLFGNVFYIRTLFVGGPSKVQISISRSFTKIGSFFVSCTPGLSNKIHVVLALGLLKEMYFFFPPPTETRKYVHTCHSKRRRHKSRKVHVSGI